MLVPPSESALVGPSYELLPSGATFQPSVIVEMTYSPSELDNLSESGLSLAAYQPGEGWVLLDSRVDKKNRTVSAGVAHFTQFSIIGRRSSFAPIPWLSYLLYVWIGVSTISLIAILYVYRKKKSHPKG